VIGDLKLRFRSAVASNPINTALLTRLPLLDLRQCWLVAGCLFQAVWNAQAGCPPGENVSDYDVFYFDDTDLSYEAEDAVIQRVVRASADLGVKVEVKNQARVHLWYAQRFGTAYPQLGSAKDGIDRFLIAGTCVALGACAGHAGALYAPFGLDDIFAGVLRPNVNNVPGNRYMEKAESYRARWPHLRLIPATSRQ
jgi:uncharacterized protein